MPGFRAKQILEWVYAKGVADPAEMTNLSKRDRDLLAAEMKFLSGEIIADQAGSDGTRKLLIQWDDAGQRDAEPEQEAHGATGETLGTGQRATGLHSRLKVFDAAMSEGLDTSRQTECVMIPAGEWATGDEDDDGEPMRKKWARRTACVSSQVGGPVGCKVCASGIGGLDGTLSAGRIVEQVWRLSRLPGVERITNVVFMGMGEPLSNFQNVTRAIRILTSLWATGISARKITISTVGLPKAIERLAEEFELPVTLALSLHAPNDDVRRQLIPWAEYTTIPELLAACQKWFDKTGREITLEYILLGSVNDRPEHARGLAGLARTLRANVNLIRYNEVKGMPFSRPGDQEVLTFQKVLRDAGVNVHIRASRGRDIAAACGQLRHEKTAGVE